jgi:eukaryotic-like serine/threonine-protein kinase
VIGPYEIESVLGKGGFGTVYRARHVSTRKQVALKILRKELTEDNPGVLVRFRREAAVGNEINSQHVVQAFDFGELDGQAYIAMELLEGQSLAEAVAARGPLSATRVKHVLLQIAEALAAAHARGVVHRDLKPENVFLLRDDFVKILDFGIAKFARPQDSLHTQTGAVFGTPDTMSPEQCRGQELDQRSDVYSLGVVAFFMLSGRYPFGGSPAEVMSGHMMLAPPSLGSVAPGAPAELAALVDRALRKDASQRFASMEEVAAAVVSPSVALAPTLPSGETVTPRRRRRWLWLGTLAIPGAAAWLMWPRPSPMASAPPSLPPVTPVVTSLAPPPSPAPAAPPPVAVEPPARDKHKKHVHKAAVPNPEPPPVGEDDVGSPFAK